MPISLDKVQTPISTLLRNVAVHNPSHEFFSFSNPATSEDRDCAEFLWSLTHVHRVSLATMLAKSFDIVHHASLTKSNTALVQLAKLRSMGRVRHIFTANCEPYAEDPCLPLYEKWAHKCDHLFGVSEVVSSSLEKKWGRKCERVIPNGFDDNFYSISNREDEEFGRGFVLYACAMINRKRPEFFLDLAERLPHRRFVMVGASEGRPRAEEIKKRAESMENVSFLGRVSRARLRDLMQAAGVLVWPSDYEGLPLTVVEALGCGLPVLAQNCSSLPEVIESGQNGWLFEIAEKEKWIAQIEKILGWSEEKREEFAGTARKSVLEKFTWSVIAQQYDEFYQSVGS